MLDPKNREGLGKGDAEFLEFIDKHGWHVMNVAPRVDSEDKQEWFSYSTGLYMRYHHPEIILCGLDADESTYIINDIGNAVKADRKFQWMKIPRIFSRTMSNADCVWFTRASTVNMFASLSGFRSR